MKTTQRSARRTAALLLSLLLLLSGSCFPALANDGSFTLDVAPGSDITGALQSALYTYSSVTIPAGEYTCGTIGIDNREGITLNGSGAILHGTSDKEFLRIRNSRNITVDNLTLTGSGDHGIVARDSTGTFTNITVTESQKCGFDAYGSETNVTIINGQFHHNGLRPNSTVEAEDSVAAGLAVYRGAVVNAYDCTCTHNTGSGVVLTTTTRTAPFSTANLYGLVSTDNGDHGIGANPASVVNLDASANRRSLITKNRNHGVMMMNHSSSSFIKATDMTQNGGMGLDLGLDSSAALVENCTMTNNGSHGVSVSRNSSIGTLTGCTISGNNNYGVYVSGAKKSGSASILIVGSTLRSNKKDGIRITGNKANGAIRTSTITGNKGSGVVIADKGVLTEITKCKVTKNKKYGISVSKGSTVNKTKGSKFTGNKAKQVSVQKGAKTKLKTKK